MSDLIDGTTNPDKRKKHKLTHKDVLEQTENTRSLLGSEGLDGFKKAWGFYRDRRGKLSFGFPYYTKEMLVRKKLKFNFVQYSVSKASYLESVAEKAAEAEAAEQEQSNDQD